MKMKKLYYIIYIFLFIIFFFLTYMNYISFYNLIYSFLLVFILALYKLLLSLSSNDEFIIMFQSSFIIKIFTKLNEKILKKNKWLIKPIYYILYYFPTNWFYLIILWIGRKWWDMRLYINSNKDIIGKKYFNKNLSYISSFLNYNNKYIIFLKKYFFNVFFRSLFLFTFLKCSLLRTKWNHFFFMRFFGIIYSTFLIVNNLSIFEWFKNTDYVSLNVKILIVCFIFYLILFCLPFLNSLYLKKVVYKNIKEVANIDNKDDKNNEDFRIKINKMLSFYVQSFLDRPNLYLYYYIKEFLLFFSLSDKFLFFIDCYYNAFLSKSLIIKSSYNINLINIRIKYGCISFNKNVKFVDFFNNMLKQKYEDNNDIIYIFEKNYRISFFLYGFFFSINMDYEDKLLNYEIYKTLYGEELVDKYFKEELEEFESLFFIYSLWGYWLINQEKIYLLIENISMKNVDDIPNFLNSNENYNKVLDLFKFLTCCSSKYLNWLDYSNYFEDSFTINIIYQDIDRYKYIYMKDKEKFIEFWVKNNKQSLQDVIMQFRLNAFDHYWKINKNISMFDEKIKKYYDENIIKNDKNVLDVLNELQEKHKKIYFQKKPNLNKSYDFLEKYNMKEEWKIFEKKNKDMFF